MLIFISYWLWFVNIFYKQHGQTDISFSFELFKDITIKVPADIVEIMYKTQYVNDEYAEFDISIVGGIDGTLKARDLLGLWCQEPDDLEWEDAYSKIRVWWADQAEERIALEEKRAIEQQIKKLQDELKAKETKAKKKGWLWW